MINKQDILDRAAEWQLRPEVVEKDYVLGWLLAAISTHRELQALWIFKGDSGLTTLATMCQHLAKKGSSILRA